MLKHIVAAAVALALAGAVQTHPAQAQTAPQDSKAKAKGAKEAKESAEKQVGDARKLSAQQQKMKDCGAKWQDEKKANGVKGREAYRKFLSVCLKG